MPLPVNMTLPNTLRGDSFTIAVEFIDGNGDPVDLTGWTLFFTLKFHRMQDDEKAAIQKRIVIEGSSVPIVFAPEDTNDLPPFSYEYDIQLSTPDHSGIRTFLIGTLTLEAGVTDAIS